MFENLKPQPADKILALMQMYREDPRDQKIDLGVGVYKNAEGVTPVMRAVKAAEKRILEEQESKAYTGLAGDPAYADAMIGLILGTSVPRANIAAVATPGGTGACRQAFEMIRMANPSARVFVSNPTWPNHLSILNYLGMETVPVPLFRWRNPWRRFRRHDRGPENRQGGRRGSAAWLLPQPDRCQPEHGAMARGCEPDQRTGPRGDDRHCLSRALATVWRKTRRRPVWWRLRSSAA